MEISKIPKETQLFELFQKQEDLKTNENFEYYTKYLTKYFQKDVKQKYEKSMNEEDQYIIINRLNEKKQIVIDPAKYVNLFQYKYEGVLELNQILYQLAYIIENKENITDDDRSQFDILKSNYLILKKHLDEIGQIESQYENELQNLFDRKLQLLTEISIYLQERQDLFDKITTVITLQEKNEIAKLIAKENPNKNVKKLKELSEYDIKELAKKMKLPNTEIEHWMKWIVSCIQYIFIQKNITKINQEIKEYMERYIENCRNFMYQPPEVEKIKLS